MLTLTLGILLGIAGTKLTQRLLADYREAARMEREIEAREIEAEAARRFAAR